jgi:ribonuclease HI
MDAAGLRALLQRLTRATPGEGVLHLPPNLPAEVALRAVRAAAEALGVASDEAEAPPAAASGAGEGVGPLRIHIDGGSRGNPGPAGIGVVFLRPDGEIVERLHRYIGRATNNGAEYQALLAALSRATEMGCREVEIVSDSELLVRQLQGRYQVRHPEIRRLFALAQQHIGKLRSFSVQHVPRALNAEADALANRGIDEGCRPARARLPGEFP